MTMTPTRVLDLNRSFNHGLHAAGDAVMNNIAQCHTTLRNAPCSRQHLGRVGEAVALNAVWGLQKGMRWGSAYAAGVGAPKLPMGAHHLRMPVTRNHDLRIAGISILGQLAVGLQRPPTASEQAQAQDFPTMHAWLDNGLVAGGLVEGCKALAAKAANRSWPRLAQACLWGAALVSAVATVIRMGVLALEAAMALGLGFPVACISAVVAGALQLINPNNGRVDFERLSEQVPSFSLI